MKDYHKVQKDRIKYHAQPNKNTVHRSSLIAPELPNANTWIGFVNHFLIKRNYKSVAMKISAIGGNGNLLDSSTLEINEPIVYSINLSDIFKNVKAKNYLIEFFSEKNLFIPFPAVIISHQGKDFCNVVHSYNRVVNDIFEDDQVNQTQVSEASFDVNINSKYDTFFNLSSGVSSINDKFLKLSYEKNKKKLTKNIKVNVPRLSYKSFYLSKIFKKKLDGGTVRIKQPKQSLFFGRLFAGKINKKTKAFSANHSYYDVSKNKEYFSSSQSYRTYPYLSNLANKIIMYPIFSPSKLNIQLKVFDKDKSHLSQQIEFSSKSKTPLILNVNDFVNAKNLKNVTAFTLIARSKNKKIPTRLSHQLIYGQKSNVNPLNCSINVILHNEKMFVPKNKTGFAWGQFISHKSYNSKIGFCFASPEKGSAILNIDFYNSNGLFKSIEKILNPEESLILNSDQILKNSNKIEFCWYVAKCTRSDLTAYSVHGNMVSGNFSGEHNF
tara:strand:- start:1405 stop:2889 length:1485 start_codon:yes stop_codon:yes gene_type:complete